jgi:uncharacterized membrane protein
MRQPSAGDTGLQRLLSRLLRAGVSLAALVSAGALVFLFARGTDLHVHDRSFHGQPAELRTLRGVLAGALELRPGPIMQLGLLILVATPIARVAFSALGFALERDRLYVALTLLVLALLVLGLLGLVT